MNVHVPMHVQEHMFCVKVKGQPQVSSQVLSTLLLLFSHGLECVNLECVHLECVNLECVSLALGCLAREPRIGVMSVHHHI